MAEDLGKLAKLVGALIEISDAYEEKRGALVAEIDALLAGKGGIGAKLKIVKAHWAAVWTARYHEQCDFDHVKHTAFLKKKLATFSPEEINAKLAHYVASEDAYYVRARHPFSLFMTSFASWPGVSFTEERAGDASDRLRGLRGDE